MNIPSRYIVWDLETSGLTPGVDRILEIGAMMVNPDCPPTFFQSFINNNIEIPEEITRITGITEEMIAEKGADPFERISHLVELLEEYPMGITHNGYRFDIPFLLGHMRLIGFPEERVSALEKRLMWTNFDTAVMYKARKMPLERGWNEPFHLFAKRVMDVRVYGLKYNVGIACDELGIDRTKVTQHRAGGDVELTHEIFKKITN